MSALFAFLHHLAAFTLVSAVAVEFVLIKGELTLENARRIQLADTVFGIASGTILIVGLLRVFYFEKGAAYYFHSAPFIAKFSLFVIVGLLSIYPTKKILAWRKNLERGEPPKVAPSEMRAMRRIIHYELAGIVFIILCAALMAHGIGYIGS